MSNSTIRTRYGETITLIADETELCSPHQQGAWLRAYCHLHGGDRQRSLSIHHATGWGQCFQCQRRVLLVSVNPEAAARLRSDGYASLSSFANPFRRVERALPQPPLWQLRETQMLSDLDETMKKALFTSPLVGAHCGQAYLEARAISLELARQTGVSYCTRSFIPTPQLRAVSRTLLSRWTERLIFPLTLPVGNGYCGRSLWRWQAGMDEKEHKCVFEQDCAPLRWLKTNPAGWFSVPASEMFERVILVEGAFDRLALLAGGFSPQEVIALVGVALRLEWLPRQVKTVILAFDADEGGHLAMRRLSLRLSAAGYRVIVCPPPDDQMGKDWSERWLKRGRSGLQSLYAL